MSTQAIYAEHALFAGGGELGSLMQEKDWSTTPLGPVRDWPQALKTAVRIVLTSRQPMFVWWGEELTNLYNDAYKSIIGGKHPQALGQPAAVVWREIWDSLGPRAAAAMAGKEGTYDEALLLIMERNGYPEETYYTFSYSPMPDDEGNTGGIFCANTDDTQRIIGERQIALLREVAARTADARTIEDACLRCAHSLETNPYDLPFALLYLLDPERRRVVLAGTTHLARGRRAAPEAAALDAASVWPFAEVIRTNAPCLISALTPALGVLPSGAWDRPPTQAVALPLAPSGQTGRAGILIVGLNPYRLFDDSYRRFLGLVSGQVAAAIANAHAYEEERKRAEALAEIDRAKTLFFSNVSHEFRTPLTLMLSPLEDMLNRNHGALKEERTEIELIHRNGLRLLKLVNSLLDFSRIEAGRVQASYVPTDLAVLTADLASSFRSAIEKAGLRLVVDCPPLLQPVYVDRDMWEKIVLNLLSNAFKFTFAGEIRISLQPSEDGAAAELTVQDTGTGIPTAELPRLFERFHRIEGARGRTHEGTGIGLALVQELVKLHGGQIRVESSVGQGSTFTVRLPFGVAHLPRERIGAVSTLVSTATSADVYVEEAMRWLPEDAVIRSQYPIVKKEEASAEIFRTASPCCNSQHAAVRIPNSALGARQPVARPRVLLADDNVDMRDYVRRLLSPHYEVTTVADGQEALVRALETPPDLVLSDVMMPRLDGFGLLRALRADPRTNTLPVLLLTARAGEESRVEGLATGADDYIVKPFSARELLARVGAHVEMTRLRQEAMRREQELCREADAARARVTTILESITDAFYTLDRQWRLTYVNPRAKELWGRPHENFIGRHIWEEFPEAEHMVFGEQVRKAMLEQMTGECEGYYPPIGKWLVLRAYPSSEGVAVYLHDITERKQAEAEREALLAEQQRQREFIERLVNHTPLAIGVTEGLDFHFRFVNRAYQALAGPDVKLLGRTYRDVFPEAAERGAEEKLLQVLQTGQPWQIRDFVTPVPGYEGVRCWEGEVLPLPEVSSAPRTLLIIAWDVTERKQAEAERERLLAELQRINAELQQFAYIVSHDLSEPLRTMNNFVQRLARRFKGKLDATAVEDMAFITDAAQRMHQMLTDLLTYTRAGQTPQFESVDCEAVLAQVLRALQASISECGAIITHDPLPTVQGDPTRLGQVFQNLIGNALKFCGEKPPCVHLSACKEDRRWRFSVRDNGIGIDPQQIGKLFQVFQRAHGKAYAGTGMGLAICKKIIEQHGGRIWVESQPHRGSVFYFTLGDAKEHEKLKM